MYKLSFSKYCSSISSPTPQFKSFPGKIDHFQFINWVWEFQLRTFDNVNLLKVIQSGGHAVVFYCEFNLYFPIDKWGWVPFHMFIGHLGTFFCELSGEGNGNPFQYSCLENSMNRRVWWAPVYAVAKSWTWLSDKHFLWSTSSCELLIFLLWAVYLFHIDLWEFFIYFG